MTAWALWRMVGMLALASTANRREAMILKGPCPAVAASQSFVAAVCANRLVLITEGGSFIKSMPQPRELASEDAGPLARVKRDWDSDVAGDILDRANISDAERARESELVEQLVDDELPWRLRRPHPRATGSSEPQPIPVLAVSTSGEIYLSRGSEVWNAALGDEELRLTLVLGEPVRGLVMDNRGELYISSGLNLWRYSVASRELTLVERRATRSSDLALCAGQPVLFEAGGIFAVREAGVERIGDAPSAQRLICTAGANLWWATGSVLYSSTDNGQTWQARDDWEWDSRSPLASTAGHLWIAGPRGLLRLSEPVQQNGAPMSALKVWGRKPRLARLAPEVILQASVEENDRGQRAVQAFALAQLSLGKGSERRVRLAEATSSDGPAQPSRQQGPEQPLDGGVPDCLAGLLTASAKQALVEPERARSYLDRAGAAAWLPELRLRVERRLGRTESLDATVDTTGSAPLGVGSTNDVRYEARATWDLSRLIFNPDEVYAQAQALRMADIRRELITIVDRLFFERRRLERELTAEDGAAVPNERRPLRIAEISAELSALTGGRADACR